MEDLQFEKVNAEIKKLNPNESFIGVYVHQSERPWHDAKIKKDVIIDQFHFTDTKGENPFIYFGDAGFKNSFIGAGIKVGDTVKIIRGDKTDLGQGREVNNYEIFRAKKKID